MVAVVANKYPVTELLRLKALGMEVNNGGPIWWDYVHLLQSKFP